MPRVSDSASEDGDDIVGARPLPRPWPDTTFFWSSGADGRLRFLECHACDRLIHPPTPICRHCRAVDAAPVAVSGSASVWSFTVVHQRFVDWLPTPYVVGVVAIAEDPEVLLTTNIVGCPPQDVKIGMPVRVRFERHNDVFLPLFEPDSGGPHAG
jgi:uncharacterized OB-fold protein